MPFFSTVLSSLSQIATRFTSKLSTRSGPVIFTSLAARAPTLRNAMAAVSAPSVSGTANFAPRTDLMLPKGTFDGKIAFVTGGGTGLGQGMVKALSALGAKVAIMSRRLEVLQKTADEISKETGNPVLPIQGDVSDPEAVKKAVDVLEAEFGLPNIVINNAAGNYMSPSERLTPDAFKRVIDIILNGSAIVTLDIGKRLIKAKQGASFLSISAVYAAHGSGFVVPSAAAKAGVEAITKSLASEWARYGMRFNTIAPGPIKTEAASSVLGPISSFVDTLIDSLPVKRMGTVEEFANIATYMVSDYSTFLNGQVIYFDGGELRGKSGSMNSALEALTS